jgi:2-dehydro-3-deoxyphosphooctonate aldolase (KDO 8-P synthase)
MKKALKILRKYRDFNVLPDIHTNEDAAIAAQYVDILQIPAF